MKEASCLEGQTGEEDFLQSSQVDLAEHCIEAFHLTIVAVAVAAVAAAAVVVAAAA